MNVTALAEDDGDVVERYLYDPYGNVTFLKADWSLQEVSGHEDGTASAYDEASDFAKATPDRPADKRRAAKGAVAQLPSYSVTQSLGRTGFLLEF